MQKANYAPRLIVSHRNDFDLGNFLSGISNTANSISGTVANTLAPLVPFQKTMSDALASIGIYPPNDIQSIANAFNQYIAAPQGVNLTTQNVTAGLLGFIKSQIQAKQAGQNVTGANAIVANGGQSVLNKLSGEIATGDIFKDPIFWVVIVVIFGGLVWFLKR